MYRSRGIIMDQLVLIAITRIGSYGLEGIADLGEINEKQAKRLYDFLAEIDLNKTYIDSLRCERVYGINAYNTTIHNGMPRPLAYADQLAYLDLFDRQINLSRIPYHQAVQRRSIPTQKDVPAYAFLTKTMLPVLTRARTASAKGVATINGSRTFLAVLAYKDRFGTYPESIAQLKSRLGWEVPTDPFTGGDFIYKRQGKGFILYSVGMDLKDDGGTMPDDAVKKNQRSDQVWKKL